MSESPCTQGSELARLYERELGRVLDLIQGYDDDELWTTSGDQKNSPGTLVLHLAGNLLHYVGAVLGGTGYARDREAEFGERVERDALVGRVRTARSVVGDALRTVTDDAMDDPFPGEMPAPYQGMTTRSFLVHLLWHVGWHQGQIYYHKLGEARSREG